MQAEMSTGCAHDVNHCVGHSRGVGDKGGQARGWGPE